MSHVQRGTMWEMHLGKAEDVLPHLQTRSVDHVMTDPPYEKEAHTNMRRGCTGAARKDGSRVFRSTPISFEAMTPELRALCMREFARLTRRWVLVFCQVEGVPLWRAEGEASGLRHMRSCVWVKPDSTPQFTGDRPAHGYECIETMLDDLACQDLEWLQVMHAKERARWNGGGRRGVFVHAAKTGARGVRSETGDDHETPKPEALMIELVDLFTSAGDVILDAFAGSGTTGVAAVRRGRRFVGIERDPRWFAYSCERLAAEEREQSVADKRRGQPSLFDPGKGTARFGLTDGAK